MIYGKEAIQSVPRTIAVQHYKIAYSINITVRTCINSKTNSTNFSKFAVFLRIFLVVEKKKKLLYFRDSLLIGIVCFIKWICCVYFAFAVAAAFVFK